MLSRFVLGSNVDTADFIVQSPGFCSRDSAKNTCKLQSHVEITIADKIRVLNTSFSAELSALGPPLLRTRMAERAICKKKVLMVGLACLDIVNVSDGYPTEDTDVSLVKTPYGWTYRLKEQIWCHGGNAGNSASILSQLGTHTAFIGTLAKHKLSDLIIDDLDKNGVSSDLCRYHANVMTPTSIVILNAAEGTRTILHASKTLPELDVEDFMKVDLNDYQWIHFEGRNVSQVLLMIERIEQFNKELQSGSSNNSSNQYAAPRSIRISMELEKPKRVINLLQLLEKGDVAFISKDVAKHNGYTTAEAAVKAFHSQCKKKNITIICAWGDQGASAIGPDGVVVSSPAFPPAQVVDTLGAGDTFNGAVIHALNRGDMSLLDAITFGCKIAGKKCGQFGLDIKDVIGDVIS